MTTATGSSNGSGLKTSFIFTKIPDTAQYKRANWEGRELRHEAMSLEQAMKVAKDNPAIAYFFSTRSSFTLEHDTELDKYFKLGDADFFAGDYFWLGSAKGVADTYLVAEVYDTSDQATRAQLVTLLKRGLFLDNRVDTSTGTKEAPRTVKAGFVFCEFQDVKGGDIASLQAKLIGPKNAAGLSALEEFVSRESDGRVKLVLEAYPSWVKLPKNVSDYTDKYPDLAKDVDQLIEFPNDWELAMFAFPETGYTTQSSYKIGRSKCVNGNFVDKEQQRLNYTFLDPTHYNDMLGGKPSAHVTTIHETMHALGLVDLYDGDLNRSYGWSIMSAAGAGWHITEFEKLLLGWSKLEDYIFLKRGMLPADPLFSKEKRAIIVIPDSAARRDDLYVIEAAQEIGVGEANRQSYQAGLKGDTGLLLMIARQDSAAGRVNPYVYQRLGDVVADREKYGGASRAAFPKAGTFATNGIFSHPVPGYLVEGKPITRVVGVDGAYVPPDNAERLRENERLVLAGQARGDQQFQLTVTGLIGFGAVPALLDRDGAPIPTSYDSFKLVNTDYGYCAYLDGKGSFYLAQSVDNTPLASATANAPSPILATWGPPANLSLAAGSYFLKLEARDGATYLAVYEQKPDGTSKRKYDLFRKPDLVRGWEQQGGDLLMSFDPSGNLKLTRQSAYLAGTYHVYNEQSPLAITFAADGAMTWLDSSGKTLMTITGKPGAGPFALAVDRTEAYHLGLVVKDKDAKILYRVMDYFEQGWQKQDGELTIAFDSSGNLKLIRQGSYLAGTYHAYPEQSLKGIAFTANGAMKWLGSGGTSLRTLSGKSGSGPFIFAVDKLDEQRWNFVVKDAAGTTLYPVMGYRFEQQWQREEREFWIAFDSSGNLQVSKPATAPSQPIYLAGTYHAYAEQSLKVISFDQKGAMTWLDGAGKTLRTLSGKPGSGPFTFAVDKLDEQRWNLVVKDKDATTLYPVMGYRFEQQWQREERELGVAFDSSGDLKLYKPAQGSDQLKYLAGTYHLYSEQSLKVISFDQKGAMTWLDGAGKTLRTIAGKTGTGPFTFAGTKTEEHHFSLVVKDKDTTTLYSVIDYFEQGWEKQDGELTIAFDTSGNLKLAKQGAYLAGTYHAYNERSLKAIALTADGAMKWLASADTTLRTIAGKQGNGPFTLAVDKQEEHCWSLVVKDAAGATLYPVLSYLERGWQRQDGEALISFGGDGQLTVKQGDTVLMSSVQAFSLQPTKITFDNGGAMAWYNGDTIAKSFLGGAGTGPFKLALVSRADGMDLVVKDSAGTTLYVVLAYTRPAAPPAKEQ